MAEGPDLMTGPVFIAGDWGSTNLRLYLCSYHQSEKLEVLASQHGPGCNKIDNNFEQIFFDLIAGWLDLYGPMPVILSGAVGANIGWHTVPYLDCPASSEQISHGTVQFTVRGLDIWILSGLQTQTSLGTPDIMRGEELQLLGWMLREGQAQYGIERIVVLPGTHNKWALVKDGQVETFVTAFTGELFALLEAQSILITEPMGKYFSADSFMQGVELAKTLEAGQLLNALFASRSRQIQGQLAAEDASCYLSGLLIASDIIGSVGLLKRTGTQLSEVVIIGSQPLSNAYQLALGSMGIEAQCCDATQIALSGYHAVYKSLHMDRP
jgi:2-dehydro-3-deoxygalactonokinase|tara:strand:+ start:311 stop:1285 length:975 start_codon:yes stop_codon:yes gene_type:complete